jgi:apolipoprotein N-acyltransferase
VAFVVWPENEFADADDPQFARQLGQLAIETGSYIVADMVWRTSEGLYDTAVMMGPDGQEVGRRAKINVTSAEEEYGFAAGPETFPVFDTPYGTVGLGVCWDPHRLRVVREVARAGAQIVLMPVDDDFRNRWFPAHHAADSVFRAVENRVAFVTGSTSGLSQVIDPYGRIAAESDLDRRSAITGQLFTVQERTPYTQFGDWFGWLMVIGLVALVWRAARLIPRAT